MAVNGVPATEAFNIVVQMQRALLESLRQERLQGFNLDIKSDLDHGRD